MIDPKQVRIGNLVFDKVWNEERAMGATDIYHLVTKSGDRYDPIALTSELVEKLGFTSSDENAWYLFF